MNKKNIQTVYDKWFKLTPRTLIYDRTLFLLYISMLTIGFIMVSSATVTKFHDPLYFVHKHIIQITMSIILFFIVISFPIAKWEKIHAILLLISIILLLCVFIPGVGMKVNGANRWLRLGILNFQPVELAKLALICYFSGFFIRKEEEILKADFSMKKPAIILIVFFVLLGLQPDLGSFILLSFIMVVMLFIAGAKIKQYIFIGTLFTALIFFIIYVSEYGQRKLKVYFDPFADPFNKGFQLTNSLMAFGNGKIFGVGLGNSIVKYSLPEAHTDFIMSIVGEELGLVGVVFILCLLFMIIYKAYKIAHESLQHNDKFKYYLANGIATWFFAQCFINFGMTINLMPTKGLTFPFISYGGSSMIVTSIAMALLIRIDFENRVAENKVFVRED